MSATIRALKKPEQLALAKLFNDKDVSSIRGGVVVAAGKPAKTIRIDCLLRLDGELTVSPDTEATVGPRIDPWLMLAHIYYKAELGERLFDKALKYSAAQVNAHLKLKQKNPEIGNDPESELMKEAAQAAADRFFKTLKVPRRGAVVFAGVVSKLGD